jgi:hypothetical protein
MNTIKLKPGTTRPAFTHTPFVAGDYPHAMHTFYDFDIPRTYALVSPVNEYGMRFAMVYTPNPWVRTEIRYYEWVLGSGACVWYRSRGSSFANIEIARLDYTKTKAKGWTPQDVIANPLNGELYCGTTWDEWTCHFSGMTQQFYRIIPVYKNTYPRKAV